jgi:hypothetical protein
MDNLILKPQTAADIDAQIQKILRGLGHPEPPLDLLLVRELLRLDREFYSTMDTSWLRERVSRLKVGGQQILQRPSLLIDAVRKFDLKALYLPDQRRILLDRDLPEKKHRWNEAHEIAHSIVPWHADMMLGDDSYTPTPECHAQIEAEANFAAGRLLFLGERFVETARDFNPSLAAVRELNNIFGNTLTTTLWRYVEQVLPNRAVVGVISSHPRRRSPGILPEKPWRYCIGSPLFQRQFSQITPETLWEVIVSYCGFQRGGPLGETNILLADRYGAGHQFHFETFFNGYDALTLGIHLGPYSERVTVGADVRLHTANGSLS